MRMYDIALFLHVIGVVTLVSALGFSLGGLVRAQRATDVAGLRGALSFVPVADRLIPAGMAFILLPGLYMVSRHGDGTIKWDSGWVDVAIGLFAVMATLGPAVESTRLKAMHQLAAGTPDGPVTPELDTARRDPVLTHVGALGSCQIVAFLFLMTNKPELAGALTTVAVAGVVSVGLARVVLHGVAGTAPAAAPLAGPLPASGAPLSGTDPGTG